MEIAKLNEDSEAPTLRFELSHLARKSSDDLEDDLFSRVLPKRVAVVLLGPLYPHWKDTLCGVHRATHRKGIDLHLLWSSDEPLDRAWRMSDSYINLILKDAGMIGAGVFDLDSKNHLEELKKKCELLRLDSIILIGGTSKVDTTKALLRNFIEDLSVGIIWVPASVARDHTSGKLNPSSSINGTYNFYSHFVRDVCNQALNAKEFSFYLEDNLIEGPYRHLNCAIEACPEMVMWPNELSSKQWKLNAAANKVCNMLKERWARGSDDKLVVLPSEFIKTIPDLYGLLLEIKLMQKLGIDKERCICLMSKESSVLFKALPHFLKKEILGFVGMVPYHTTQERFEKVIGAQVDSMMSKEERYTRPLYTSDLRFGYAPFSYAIGNISGKILNYEMASQALTRIANPQEWRCGSSEFLHNQGEKKMHKLRIHVVKDKMPKEKEVQVGPFKMSRKEWRNTVLAMLLSWGPAVASPFVEYLSQRKKDILEALDAIDASQFQQDPLDEYF